MLAQGFVGRVLCAGALGVVFTSQAFAVSCPDLVAKRIEQFRKAATSGATRCLKREARTGVSCPDAKLTEQLAKKRAAIVRSVDRRCPGSGIDAALVDVQTDVVCQVLAVCPPLPIGEITQRVVAASGSGARSAPRNLSVDLGWSGVSHGLRILEGAEFTAELSNCDGETDTLCDLDGATNGLTFGPPSPFAAGGIGVCMVLNFASDLMGTIDTATGEVSEHATLHGSYYFGPQVEEACPVCNPADGDPELGEAGLCSYGPNAGQPCTVDGLTQPIFAGVSHDCLPEPLSLVGEFTVPLDATTGSVAFATTVDSPRCTGLGLAGQRCHCATCNDVASTSCTSNADCPVADGAPGICGGSVCFGGPRDGLPCTVKSNCPGTSSLCNRKGEPTRPNACYDGICTATAEGSGVCLEGPDVQVCELESWRYCGTDDDCPRTGDSCTQRLHPCFLDTIAATGTPDVPSGTSAEPTLVGTFCVGPTYSAAVNYVGGLPGPVRFVWPALLTFDD